MCSKFKALIFLALSLTAVATVAAAQTAPVEGVAANSAAIEARDYVKYDFKISLESLRAGAHDKTGINDYYFTVQMFGLVNTQDERQKPFTDQRKIAKVLGKFGSVNVKSLEFWRADPKEGLSEEFPITGDSLRDLVAETMQTFQVKEDEISVLVTVEMFELEKKFMFFGEDQKIAETKFYPIPQTTFDTPSRTNLAMTMKDDKGADVRFQVTYEFPVESAKRP